MAINQNLRLRLLSLTVALLSTFLLLVSRPHLALAQGPDPILEISKTVTPTLAQAGELITYTLTITNRVGYTVTGLVITDAIPANAYYVSASDDGIREGNVISWTRSPLAAGDTVSPTFVVTATQTITNQFYRVSAISGTTTYSATGDSPIRTEVVTPIAGLNVTNSSPTALGYSTAFTANITAGSNVSYTWNFGDSTPVQIGSENRVGYTYPAAGLYTAIVTASNNLGSHPAATDVQINAYVYLPIIMNNFTPGMDGWSVLYGKFDGHGSGLPVGPDNGKILLGNRNATNGNIKVGYGGIRKLVTKQYLKIEYEISTFDIVKGASTGKYYDTFEASVREPNSVSPEERDVHCTEAKLNPVNLINNISDGLVFCGGHWANAPGSFQEKNKTVTLDLGSSGKTVYLTLWSREYEPAYFNDQAYYNSWVYLKMTESDTATFAANETAVPEVITYPAEPVDANAAMR